MRWGNGLWVLDGSSSPLGCGAEMRSHSDGLLKFGVNVLAELSDSAVWEKVKVKEAE